MYQHLQPIGNVQQAKSKTIQHIPINQLPSQTQRLESQPKKRRLICKVENPKS
jgi:hypothetical protein